MINKFIQIILNENIMKCTLSIFLVIIFTFQMAKSQVTDTLTQNSQKEMYDFYSINHKKQKKTAWILLGAGVLAAGGGLAIAENSSVFDESDSGFTSGSILFLAGSASILTSIPFFIISGSNKRKAEAILETGKIGFGSIPLNNQRYVSVGLRIDF